MDTKTKLELINKVHGYADTQQNKAHEFAMSKQYDRAMRELDKSQGALEFAKILIGDIN